MGITSNLSFLLIDYFTADTDSAPIGAFQYLQTKTAPGIGQGREIRGTTLIYAETARLIVSLTRTHVPVIPGMLGSGTSTRLREGFHSPLSLVRRAIGLNSVTALLFYHISAACQADIPNTKTTAARFGRLSSMLAVSFH